MSEQDLNKHFEKGVYGIRFIVKVSDEKWSTTDAPGKYIANTLSVETKLVGEPPQFQSNCWAASIHDAILFLIKQVNKNGTIDNTLSQAVPKIVPKKINKYTQIHQRLDMRLKQARADSGVSKYDESGTKVTGGTIAVAETNFPFLSNKDNEFVAGSPQTGKLFSDSKAVYDRFKPPITNGWAQNHAEQGLVGKISKAIEDTGQENQSMDGYSVFIHVEQTVCNMCKAGLAKSQKKGVLKQFSVRYPVPLREVQRTGPGAADPGAGRARGHAALRRAALCPRAAGRHRQAAGHRARAALARRGDGRLRRQRQGPRVRPAAHARRGGRPPSRRCCSGAPPSCRRSCGRSSRCAVAPSLDRRTDIYSIGALLWEMLTGEHLVPSDDGAPPPAPSSRATRWTRCSTPSSCGPWPRRPKTASPRRRRCAWR